MTALIFAACDLPRLPHFAGGQHQPGVDVLQYDAAMPRDAVGEVPLTSDATQQGEVCIPNCYGKSCGPDGCGGVCGLCPAGTVCAHDHSTCIPRSLQKPPGQACMPTEFCKPYLQNDYMSGSYYRNSEWPACLDDQCRDGPCWQYKCTQRCTRTQDQGATTDKGQSGQECPQGTKCVPWQQGGVCLPDATYAPCRTRTDCTKGEYCTPLPVQGKWGLRCTPPWGDGGLGAPCNEDPDKGDIRTCKSGICMDKMCSRACSVDQDCIPTGITCNNGQCPDGRKCQKDTDCSPYQCQPASLFGNQAFNICIRKTCSTNSDCPADFYCRPALWSQGFAKRCEPRHHGGRSYGEACDRQHPCAQYALCLDGRCSQLCNTDKDCPFGLCTVHQQDLRAIVPYMGQAQVAFAACDPVHGSLDTCTGNTTCKNGVCRHVVVLKQSKNGGLTPVSKGVCIAPAPSDGTTGEQCNNTSLGPWCASGLCMDSVPGQGMTGYCAATCSTQQDCPAFMAKGGNVFRTLCTVQSVLSMGTPNPLDDILSGVCMPVSPQSSLNSCKINSDCPGTQVCSPRVQGYPKSPVIKSYCIMPAPGAVLPGQGCDPWTGHVKCSTGLCVPGNLPQTGICTVLCNSDAQCQALSPELRCVSRPILPKLSNLTVSLCLPPALCTSCMDDTDCMPGYGCVDTSMGSWPRDYRCMPLCAAPKDCQAHGYGKTCAPLPCPVGSSGGASHDVCVEITCP